MTKKQFFAHPQALVGENAVIGDGTRIWAFAHILDDASIGERCNICNYAFVESGVTIGNNVTVKNGVQIYRGVTIEDDAFLGPNCVFTNHFVPRSFIKQPEENWLRTTLIKKGATIGAGAVIVCGNTIGRYAFVAAGSVVTKDVQQYAMVKGVPARFHSWICACGEKLTLENEKAKCAACGLAYLFNRSENSLQPAS